MCSTAPDPCPCGRAAPDPCPCGRGWRTVADASGVFALSVGVGPVPHCERWVVQEKVKPTLRSRARAARGGKAARFWVVACGTHGKRE